MSASQGYIDTTVFAEVTPRWGSYVDYEGRRSLWSIAVTKMTQKRPRSQKGGTVLVKLTLRIPRNAFEPLRPEAIVVVPESLTETKPVEVVAVDPAGESDG